MPFDAEDRPPSAAPRRRYTRQGAALLMPSFVGDGVNRRSRARQNDAFFAAAVAVRAARGPLVAGSSLGAIFDARGGTMSELLLDAAGRRRSPATMPEFHAGRPPRNKGMRMNGAL